MKDIISESIRYWEPRRFVFNAALAMVVVGTMLDHHSPLSALTWQSVGGLMFMAAVANVLYCAAYVADLFVQLSDYQPAWKRHRWVLLAVGTILAADIFLLHE